MVELELLEGGKGTVARLAELELAPFELAGLAEGVVARLRLTQVRQRDYEDACGSEERAEEERQAHDLDGTPATE